MDQRKSIVSHGNRIPSLDGLRALSILLVLAGHLYGTVRFPTNRVTFHLKAYSHFGVQVFFVISGFLITTLLLREAERNGAIDWRAFYRRRIVRIFPCAYAYIIIVTLVFHPPLKYTGVALIYGMSYMFDGVPWIFRHLWSLSVEEQFYILWPLLLFLGLRLRRRFAWGVMVLAPVLRVTCWKMGFTNIEYYFPTVADALAAGCLLAMYRPFLQTHCGFLKRPVIFVGLSALTLALPLVLHSTLSEISLGGITPSMIALCTFAAIERQEWFLNMAWLRWIGVMSYSLYVWQQPFLDSKLHSLWTSFPINVAAAFVCAYASYKLIETPAMAFKVKPTQIEPQPLAAKESLIKHSA